MAYIAIDNTDASSMMSLDSDETLVTKWILIQTKSGKKLSSEDKKALKWATVKIDEYISNGVYLCRYNASELKNMHKLQLQLESFIDSIVAYAPLYKQSIDAPAWQEPNPMSYRLFAYSYARSVLSAKVC